MSVSGSQVVFLAGNGEVNSVTVSESGGILTIQDSTAPITSVSSEYTVVSSSEVTIPVAGISQVNLTLLDGNDSLDASGLTASSGLTRTVIQGGTGNDVLVGSGLDDFFIEETGNDSIDGLTAISADQWTINRDADMVLTDIGVTFDGVETDLYTNIEVVSLLGGVSDNVIDASAATPASGLTGVIFNGREGNDTLIGGETRDIFQDRIGANSMIGGSGSADDSIFFIEDQDMSADDTTVTVGGITSSHVGIERIDLWGGAGDNIIDVSGITSASSFDSIQLQGFDGNDTLIGSALSDTIRDSGGVNTLDGGGASDILIIQADLDQILTNTTLEIDSQVSTHSNFEDIRLNGGNSANVLDASALDASSGVGFVSLQGLDGDDTLLGSQVVDEIRSRGGNNVIDGGGSPIGRRDRVVFFQDLDMTATDDSVIVGLGVNTLRDIEDLRLVGDASDNTIDASDLTQASGVEQLILFGGAGNDVVRPPADIGLVSSSDGGSGFDIFDLSRSSATPVVTFAGAGSIDGQRGSYTMGDVFSSFNNVDDIVLPSEYDFTSAQYNVSEGDSSNVSNVIEITRSVNTSISSSVDVVLTAGSASEGTDYAVGVVTVEFLPGEVIRSVPLEILGDETVELDETVGLSLANGIVGSVQPVSELTIENDDSAEIRVSDVTQAESDTGQVAFEFAVTLSGPVDVPVTLLADSIDDSATVAGGDYQAVAGLLVNFPAASGSQEVTVSVLVNGDQMSEADESFLLRLTSLQAGERAVALLDGEAVGTIIDDDVSNQPPQITSLETDATFAAKGRPLDAVQLSALFTDANLTDLHTATVSWGDGNVSEATIDQDSFLIVASHEYESGGLYEVTLVVSDGSDSDSSVTTAVVSGSRLTSDGELQIIGTSGRDRIQIQQRRGRVRVKFRSAGEFDERTSHPASDVDTISIYACEGDDHIQFADSVTKAAMVDAGAGDDFVRSGSGDDLIRGGAGHDWIEAGEGNNIVLGGSGHDILFAGWGRDLMIGGTGCDLVFGGGGQDIMIGGGTVHDEDDTSLSAIRDEWTSEKSFAVRRSNLIDGSGGDSLNGTVFLDMPNLIDDDELDLLFGQRGRDWYPEY